MVKRDRIVGVISDTHGPLRPQVLDELRGPHHPKPAMGDPAPTARANLGGASQHWSRRPRCFNGGGRRDWRHRIIDDIANKFRK
jgi:hypothetical protein